MTKHTPGPWEWVVEDGDEWWFGGDGVQQAVIQKGDESIAVLGIHGQDEVELANARLIAAAPQLLEALEGLYAAWYKVNPGAFEEQEEAALAAIKAARGGS